MNTRQIASLLACCFAVNHAAGQGETPGYENRTGAAKKRLLKEFGGSEESEEAVMLGLAWLTQMQKPDGHWVLDRGHTADHAAATGLAVLAFLGAGQSHQTGRYKQTVQSGLDWLVKNIDMNKGPNYGKFNTEMTMYSQAIATMALCEAAGMCKDTAIRSAAQAGVDYIQKAQVPNGSWGYLAGTSGDTSIVGWQLQALHAAKLAKLEVDENVLTKASRFLDSVGTGAPTAKNKGLSSSKKAGATIYGYGGPGGIPVSSLTAIGLLCRYYIDGWRSDNPSFAAGAEGLMPGSTVKRKTTVPDYYFFYYATQVVRFNGGDNWKIWNEGTGGQKNGMADTLIKLQTRTPTERGSWAPDNQLMGQGSGRLGVTCLALLTLEVYYRYSPEDKLKDGGDKKPIPDLIEKP